VNISLFSDFRHLWQLINVSEIGNLRVSTCTVSPNFILRPYSLTFSANDVPLLLLVMHAI